MKYFREKYIFSSRRNLTRNCLPTSDARDSCVFFSFYLNLEIRVPIVWIRFESVRFRLCVARICMCVCVFKVIAMVAVLVSNVELWKYGDLFETHVKIV